MDVTDLLRIGQVSSVNPVNGSCRVAFDDLDGKVCGELQIAKTHTDKAKFFSLPEVGEHVLCAFLPNGTQEGFVLGSLYTAYNLPEEGKTGLYRIEFEDGTTFQYDRDTRTATLETEYHVVVEAGDIMVTAQDAAVCRARTVKIEAPTIILNGNVQVNGSIHATGSVIDGGTNTNHHTH